MTRATRVADDLVDCNAVGHEFLKLGLSSGENLKRAAAARAFTLPISHLYERVREAPGSPIKSLGVTP